MSKVYSFRLSDDNPREAQAREVIEAWVAKGYSLRYVIVETLISYQHDHGKFTDMEGLFDQIQQLIFARNKVLYESQRSNTLSSSFVSSLKQTAKTGIRAE